MHTRGEGGGPNGQRKNLCLNFSCLALKCEFLFILFFKFIDLFIYLFIFGCFGSSLLHVGFL